MQQTIFMGEVIDLCNILAKAAKHSINIECAVRILDEVAVPKRYERVGSIGNVVWYKVGLLFGKILPNAADFADTGVLAELPQDAGAMYGCLVVALPKDFAKFCTGSRKDLMLRGKVYLAPNTVNDITMLRWCKSLQDGGKCWEIGAVEVAALDLTTYPAGLCFLYKQLCDASVGVTLKRFYDLHGLNPCNLSAQCPPGPIRHNRTFTVTYDTVTSDILKIEVTSAVQTQALDKRGTTATIATPALGVTSAKLAHVNRSVFYADDAFAERLQVLLREKNSLRNVLEKDVRKWRVGITYATYAPYIATGIRQNWVRKAVKGSGTHTGRNLLEKTICDAVDAGVFYAYVTDNVGKLAALKTTAHAICMDKTQAMGLLDLWCAALVKPYITTDKKPKQNSDIIREVIQQFAETFVLLFLRRLLRLSCDITHIHRNLKTFGLDFWNVMFHNPYVYCYLFPEAYIKLSDLDRIACLAGVYNNAEVQRVRAAVWVHRCVCATDNGSFNGSTLVYQQELLRKTYTDTYTGSVGKALITFGRIVDEDTTTDLETFMHVAPNCFEVSRANVIQKANTATLTYAQDIVEAFNSYMSSVFGIKLSFTSTPSVTDATYLSKELAIYEICRNKAVPVSDDDVIRDETIERYIAEFEQEKTDEWGVTVKLEGNQREALRLINTKLFAITGGAGTGKTTIIELLTRIIQRERGVKDEEVLYIAPTGKAAVRLRSVVKHPAMTIHSACRITGVPGADKHRSRNALSAYKLIVVDEASMIDLDTMHTLVSSLPDDSITVFVGDIAQLAPIGAGKPFASMLRYVPVHALDVVKRVSSDDLIAQNSRAFLDGERLTQGKNYTISQVDEASIADDVERICTQHLMNLNGITPDDIQIVTPVRRGSYSWGCEQLNTRLRPIFNPNVNTTAAVHVVAQRNGGTECKAFYIGDRVVHMQNDYKAVRYSTDTDGRTFLPAEFSGGVVNGDIGKVRYIVDGSVIRFGNDGEVLSAVAASKRAGKVYMFVEYQDVNAETMTPQAYLICYPLDKAYHTEDTQTTDETTARTLLQRSEKQVDVPVVIKTKYTVKSEGLESLQLAYALTVHKLEGSQVKLAICILYGTQNRTFISRNLVNTMLTRATDRMYLLGDVTPGGVMTQAAKVDVLQMRLAVFDFYPQDNKM